MSSRFQFLWVCLSVMAININIAYSQNPGTDESPIQLEEIAVTATRVEKDTFRTPNAISVVSRPQIERMNADVTPRILSESAGVFSQQTTVGQGSPILRGLTGYQTFIQVDGVRLNNSTFRSGPNQYLATISPDGLDRIEVLRGPGSMLYGSGAMGGVISVFTEDLGLDDAPPSWDLQSRLFGRYASASQERIGRLKITGRKNRFGFAVGASARQFGDMNSGSGFDLHHDNRKFEIVSERPTNLPLLDGPPADDIPEAWLIDEESPLDWKAYDGDAKIAYQLSGNSTVNLAYQLWRQPETPRYDRISTGQFDQFFFAPQDRDLVYATYLAKQVGSAIDQIRLTTSYHRQKEGRKEVARGSTERRERFDTVNTFGVSAQATNTSLPRQRVVVGGEFYFDTLDSRTVRTDLNTGTEDVDDTWGRFPDGAQFWDANFFVQDEIELHDRVELTLGGRLTLYHTEADLSVRDPSFGEFSESDQALTGSAGIVVGLTDGLNLVGNAATSFRAPNLNDTTAVEVTNEGIDAPSPNLEAENGWTVEGGLKARYPHFVGSLTFYHSRIDDLVTRVPVEEAFRDEPLPKLYRDIQAANPDLDVFVQDNIDEVQIQGIEFTGAAPIRSGWSVYGNGTLTLGKVLRINGNEPDPAKPWEERIRREPPLNGMIGVRWEQSADRFWGEFFARGAVKQDRLSRGDIRDPRIPGKTRDTAEVQFDEEGRAIDAGTPGWYTLNLRG
ncbi:MAG: TonB-dependent receptor, partial [Candidatus Poribacteria bacterium]|nr:TonB-dependent receptor [Candidatus Poribacteria bacterium]